MPLHLLQNQSDLNKFLPLNTFSSSNDEFFSVTSFQDRNYNHI